jgi:hypothetical protein
MQVQALPFKIGSLSASRDKMKEMADSLVALGEGASIAIDTASRIVTYAENTHTVLTAVQAAGGVGVLVQTGARILSQKGLSACVRQAALEVRIAARSAVASALSQLALEALPLTESERHYLKLGLDFYQIACFAKAVRAQQRMRLGDCFAAGTQVITAANADGSYSSKAIEEINIGDWVVARDDANPSAPLQMKQVTQVFIKTSDHLRVLEVEGDDGNIEVIRTTDVHPFYVDGRGWVNAGELQAGDRVQETDGSWHTVLSTVREGYPGGFTVYNIEVGEHHTYFVEDGFGAVDPVWVHNAEECGGSAFLNKLRHIFGDNTARHKLGGYVAAVGNEAKALQVLDAATQAHVRSSGLPDGLFSAVVTVKGFAVTVTGNIIGGTAHIGTAYIP